MPKHNPFVTAPIKPAAVKRWWDRIQMARTTRKEHEEDWDILVKAYTPEVKERGVPEDITTNMLFRFVEQKKAVLFFRSPEMRLRPKEQMMDPISSQDGQPIQGSDGQPVAPVSAVTIHEQVLNHYLGPDEVNLPLLADQVLFDCLCPSGLMVSKIGYRAYTKTIQEPVMTTEAIPDGTTDPLTGLPGQSEIEVPAMDERGQPMMQDVPVLLKEEYFWSRVSPKKVLIPNDFHSTDFEQAPWLGVEFTMPLRDAKRLYGLPDDFEPKKGETDEKLLGEKKTNAESKDEMVSGVEIFYRASHYIDDVVHPDIYYQLVLIEGHEERDAKAAAVHRQSPF